MSGTLQRIIAEAKQDGEKKPKATGEVRTLDVIAKDKLRIPAWVDEAIDILHQRHVGGKQS
jgi:hypothetical protein